MIKYLIVLTLLIIGCKLNDDGSETYVSNPLQTIWVNSDGQYNFSEDGTVEYSTTVEYGSWQGRYIFDDSWLFVYNDNGIIMMYGQYQIDNRGGNGAGELTITDKKNFKTIKLVRNYD